MHHNSLYLRLYYFPFIFPVINPINKLRSKVMIITGTKFIGLFQPIRIALGVKTSNAITILFIN